MVFASWPSPPARELADTLSRCSCITEVVELAPHETQKALLEGKADLALIPTFDALRADGLLELLPGVGLVGERSPTQVLAVTSRLDEIRTVAFDPRFAQEALLTQIILKESYGGKPTFVAADPAVSVSDRLANNDATLVAPNAVPEGNIALDLGQEWLELTLRPMVWGLLAARTGETEAGMAREILGCLRTATEGDARAINGEHGYQFTLDGYAMDSLEELVQHLYYHGSLLDVPELAFVAITEEQED